MQTEARENPWRQAVSEKLCKNNNFIVYLKVMTLTRGFFVACNVVSYTSVVCKVSGLNVLLIALCGKQTTVVTQSYQFQNEYIFF